MSDDYLWDRSGKPDPEVERLERLLAPLGHTRPAPEFKMPVRRFPGVLLRAWPQLAAAAAVVLVMAATWVFFRAPQGSWEIERVAGTPRVGSRAIGATDRLAVGQWLVTDAASRARISVGMIGEVEVEPNTRLRLLQARPSEHRLALERGLMHARIWAPPRLFYVDTPSAVAVDLGCKYTLHVDDTGAGMLHVTMGWVAFELNGRESFVPEGALCATRPGVGPGTPYFEDASAPLQAALAKLDFGGLNAEERAAALGVVLAESRPRDALTLWHLLSRVAGTERGRVYDRMAQLIPPPKGITREGILAGDRQMLDLWWNELGLKSASFWRMWKGSWPLKQQK